MSANKKLYMEFLDTGGNTKTLSIDNPKDNLDNMTVLANMTAIISSNVIDSKGHDLYDVKQAYYREVVTTKVI